jgi:hypothetical protein
MDSFEWWNRVLDEFERAEDKRWRNAGTPKADSRNLDVSMASAASYLGR